MKRNRAFRRFAAVFLALFCMAATSTVAFAGGGDGEGLLHRGGDHGRL